MIKGSPGRRRSSGTNGASKSTCWDHYGLFWGSGVSAGTEGTEGTSVSKSETQRNKGRKDRKRAEPKVREELLSGGTGEERNHQKTQERHKLFKIKLETNRSKIVFDV